MLNIAGPEYDFAHVVFAVLEECEHRRRSYERDQLEIMLTMDAKAKLKQIKEAYDEFGGSASYWTELEREVLSTALPQYIDAARKMHELERSSFGVWRDGDPAARGIYALGGLLIGGLVKKLPFVPTVENMFVLALAVAGAVYPEIKRYTHERRHAKMLNRLVEEAGAYQRNAKLHYMTTTKIRESFTPGEPVRTLGGGTEDVAEQ